MEKTKIIEIPVAGHWLAAVCLNPGATGEPVILLHGITSTIGFWQVQPESFLLDIGPCYALSLPGHSPAMAPASFKRATLTADSVLQPLDEAICHLIGDRPATIIGHSTGGFAALGLAARRPAIARRVVSIAGFAHGRWTGILGIYQQAARLGWPGEAFFKSMYGLLQTNKNLFRWAMRFYAADTNALYANPGLPEMVERSFPPFQKFDLNVILSYFKSMPQIDISSELPHISAQTLVITGDQDPIVPPAQSQHIAQTVPNAELAIIQGSGHLPFAERTKEYNQQLSTWLAKTNLPKP